MAKKTLYDVLQVSRNADPETIKAAYKSLVQRHHPDKNPDTPDAENYLKEINHAYAVLSDPAKRVGYDAALAEEDEDGAANRSDRSDCSSAGTPGGNGFPTHKASPINRSRSFLWNLGYWFGRTKRTDSFDGSTFHTKKRDYLAMLDLFAGVVAGQFCSKWLSTAFQGTPAASGLVAGLSFLLGGGLGVTLCHYLRMQFTKNMQARGPIILGSLFVSLGLAVVKSFRTHQ